LILLVRIGDPYVLSACSRWSMIMHRTLNFRALSLDRSSATLKLRNSSYIAEL
jgi:hypothetical protein